MLLRATHYLRPPIFDDEEKNRIANLLNIILLAIIAGGVMYAVALVVVAPEQLSRLAIIAGIALSVTVGLLFLMRRGQVRLASFLIAYPDVVNQGKNMVMLNTI